MKKAILFALAASFLWSIVSPFIKIGLSYDFEPLNFAGIRFTSVGIILLLYSARKFDWKQIFEHRKLYIILILFNIFFGYATFYFGMDLVRADIASIVIGINPLLNVLMAHFIAKNDKLDTFKILSMIVALIGLLYIIGMGNEGKPLEWKAIGGVALILTSIVLQAYSTIRLSEERGDIPPIFMNGVQMFFGGGLLYLSGLLFEGYCPIFDKPALFYISLGVLVFVSTFAFSFWFIALRISNAKVSDLNMTKLISPIVGSILSWIMLADESPNIPTVSGMMIVIFALLVYFKGKEIMQSILRKNISQK